jgi:hypothetical protein
MNTVVSHTQNTAALAADAISTIFNHNATLFLVQSKDLLRVQKLQDVVLIVENPLSIL